MEVLPIEIKELVLEKLDLSSLSKLSQTCFSFNVLVKNFAQDSLFKLFLKGQIDFKFLEVFKDLETNPLYCLFLWPVFQNEHKIWTISTCDVELVETGPYDWIK